MNPKTNFKILLFSLLVSFSVIADVSQTEEITPLPETNDATKSSEPTDSMPEKSEVVLSKEDENLLAQIRAGKEIKKEPVNDNKLDRFNKKSRIKRGDNRILIEHLDVGDIYEIKTCYGSPFRISFGKSLNDKIYSATLGNIAKFTHDVDATTRRSIVIAQKEAESEGSVHTTLWLVRNSDKRAYVFNITGEPCPSQGLLTYPVEVIVEKKEKFDEFREEVLLPTDYVTTVTQNFERKNDANFISVNGIVLGEEVSSIGVSIVLKNITTQTKIREPRMVVLKWSKAQSIDSKQTYLPFPSQAETNINKLHTLRFNLQFKMGKREIMERNFVYLLIIFDDEKYYQIAKVPLKDLVQNLSDQGWEI